MARKKPTTKKTPATRGRPRGGNPVTKYKVESGIDMPSRARGSLANQLPLDDMEVGDSFVVQHDKLRWKTIDTMLASLRNYGYQHKFTFVVRIVTEKDEQVARMWRTD